MADKDEVVDRGDELETGSGGASDKAETKVDDKVDTKVEEKVVDKGEDKGEEEEKDPKAKLTIPKAVFDERIKKAREREEVANRRAEEAEAKLKAQAGDIDVAKIDAEIDDLEEKLEKAVADNNPELKKQYRGEIRAKVQAIAEARASVQAQYQSAVAIEQVRYDAAVSRMEMEHPELNPDSEETYSQDAIDELTDLKEAYEAKGESSTVALNKALRVMYRGAKPPEKEEKKEEKKEDAEKKGAARTEDAVKAALEAKKKQPSSAKVGLASDKAGKAGDAAKDVLKMSDKEFDKLDKDALAKARGDDFVGE